MSTKRVLRRTTFHAVVSAVAADLAVDIEAARLPVDVMSLFLAGVMRDVIEQIQLRRRQDLFEDAACQCRQYLPIGERAVDAGTHGAEVSLAERRGQRR